MPAGSTPRPSARVITPVGRPQWMVLVEAAGTKLRPNRAEALSVGKHDLSGLFCRGLCQCILMSAAASAKGMNR